MRKDEKKKKKNGRICISGRNYSTRTNAPVMQPSFDYGLDAKPAFQCSANIFREAYSSGDNRHRVTRNAATHHAPLPRECARDEMTRTVNRAVGYCTFPRFAFIGRARTRSYTFAHTLARNREPNDRVELARRYHLCSLGRLGPEWRRVATSDDERRLRRTANA